MDDHPAQLSAYGNILLMGVIGVLLVVGTIFLTKVIAPRNPNPIKLSTYECGEETVGSAWSQFNPRFYVIALIFLLFDVELIFILPWATVFGNSEFIQLDGRWGWFTLVEMGLFIGVLILGLLYVWKRGYLDWLKVTHVTPQVATNIPMSAYDELNRQEYVLRDYREVLQDTVLASGERTSAAAPQTGFKPKFRPTKS